MTDQSVCFIFELMCFEVTVNTSEMSLCTAKPTVLHGKHSQHSECILDCHLAIQ